MEGTHFLILHAKPTHSSHFFIVKVQKIPLKGFIEWLELKLNDKYDIALEGLKLRFLTFYQIIKGIIDYVLDLRELVEQAK